MDDMIGRTLGDRYCIEERLGVGGVGAVYRATHLTLGRPVAVKLLLEGLDPSFRARFEREAKALAGLRHPNIVSIVDYGVSEDTPYLVMELLEGETVGQRLHRGPITGDQVLEIARQLLRALSFVHEQGLVHRDLKPGNLFIEKLPDNEERLKLLDFGLAKFIEGGGKDEPPVTRAGHAVGTPAYMAPEQVAGDAADARTDCYGVGVLLFQMICGRVPFQGEPMEQLRSSLVAPAPALAEARPGLRPRPELEALVQRAMAKPREARFQSATEMLAALEAVPRPWFLDDPALADTALAGSSGSHASMAPTMLRAQDGEKPPLPAKKKTKAAARAKEESSSRPRGVWLLLALAAVAAIHFAKPAEPSPPHAAQDDAIAQPPVEVAAAPPPAEPAAKPSTEMVIEPAEVEAPEPLAAQPNAEPAAAEEQAAAEPEEVVPAPPPAAPAAEPGAETAAPEATATPTPVAVQPGAAAPAHAQRPPAHNPWARGVPPPLAAVRRAVMNGDQLGERTIVALRKYNRMYSEDVRGHLVLARLFMNRNWRPDAFGQYQVVVQLDPGARGAPEMLPDLLKMVAQGKVAGEASRLVRRVYGTEALPAIARALAGNQKDNAALERLRALRASIGGT